MEDALETLPRGERVLALVAEHGGLSISDLRRLLSEPISDTLQLLIRGHIWDYVDGHINWIVQKAAVLALLRETDRWAYYNDYRLDLRWLGQFSSPVYSAFFVVDDEYGWTQEEIDIREPGPQFRDEMWYTESDLPSPEHFNKLPSELHESIIKHLTAAQDLCRVIAACRSDENLVQICKDRLLEIVRDSVVQKMERALALDRLTALASVQPFANLNDVDPRFFYTAYPVDYYDWENEIVLADFPAPVWLDPVEEWRSCGEQRVCCEDRAEYLGDALSHYPGWSAPGYWTSDNPAKPNWADATYWGG